MLILNHIIVQIKNVDCGHMIWVTLKSLYEIQSEIQLMFLRNKLYSLQIGEEEKVIEFKSGLNGIKVQLVEIHDQVQDKEKLLFTLNYIL